MSDALLEIGVESLPARFVPLALAQWREKVPEALKARGLSCSEFKVYGTPMRLALVLSGLPERSEAKTLEVTGPPARLLKGPDGDFTPQAKGFAKSQGVSPEEIVVVSLPKGEFLAAQKSEGGKPTPKLLAEIFPELVRGLQFPKTLHWEATRFRFARPIRSLAALCGKRTVPFELAGVRSGNRARGPASSGAKPLRVPSPEAYPRLLRERCVIADPAEREALLRKSLLHAAKRSSGSLKEEPELLEQIVYLTEHPVPVLGRFAPEFLRLPEALLTTVLRTQLKFFPLWDGRGRLVCEFLGVRDGVSEGQKDVQAGYERVLRARLSDASFFFARDVAAPLESKREALGRVGFQKGLGSLLEKGERLERLSEWLCSRLLQDRPVDGPALRAAARRAYCDLTTEVVKEFPELQGTMGGVYARKDGLGEREALALEEFYYPLNAKSPLPSHLEGCLLSLAGKTDSLAALFAAGFRASGSEDPFGLRRLGMGVVRILLERQLPVAVPELVARSLALVGESLPAGGLDLGPKTRDALCEFLWQRLESLALELGYRLDELRSVREGGMEDLARTFRRLAAVRAVRREARFGELAQAFKRASQILKQGGEARDPVAPELLGESAEKELFSALCRAEGEVGEKTAGGDYEAGLRRLVELKPQVDAFFEEVLVMAEEPRVRANRLALLSRLVRLFKSVADLSHIQN